MHISIICILLLVCKIWIFQTTDKIPFHPPQCVCLLHSKIRHLPVFASLRFPPSLPMSSHISFAIYFVNQSLFRNTNSSHSLAIPILSPFSSIFGSMRKYPVLSSHLHSSFYIFFCNLSMILKISSQVYVHIKTQTSPFC
jgi:hypothetical protein